MPDHGAPLGYATVGSSATRPAEPPLPFAERSRVVAKVVRWTLCRKARATDQFLRNSSSMSDLAAFASCVGARRSSGRRGARRGRRRWARASSRLRAGARCRRRSGVLLRFRSGGWAHRRGRDRDRRRDRRRFGWRRWVGLGDCHGGGGALDGPGLDRFRVPHDDNADDDPDHEKQAAEHASEHHELPIVRRRRSRGAWGCRRRRAVVGLRTDRACSSDHRRAIGHTRRRRAVRIRSGVLWWPWWRCTVLPIRRTVLRRARRRCAVLCVVGAVRLGPLVRRVRGALLLRVWRTVNRRTLLRWGRMRRVRCSLWRHVRCRVLRRKTAVPSERRCSRRCPCSCW